MQTRSHLKLRIYSPRRGAPPEGDKKTYYYEQYKQSLEFLVQCLEVRLMGILLLVNVCCYKQKCNNFNPIYFKFSSTENMLSDITL